LEQAAAEHPERPEVYLQFAAKGQKTPPNNNILPLNPSAVTFASALAPRAGGL